MKKFNKLVNYLWKQAPLNPIGTPSFLYSPVQNCLKFSAVLGTTSANNSNLIRPISCLKLNLKISIYRKTKILITVVPIVISKTLWVKERKFWRVIIIMYFLLCIKHRLEISVKNKHNWNYFKNYPILHFPTVYRAISWYA